MMRRLYILWLVWAAMWPVCLADRQADDDVQQRFDSLYFTALDYLLQAQTDSAFAYVEQAIAVDSLSCPALHLRSQLYRRMNRNSEALYDALKAARLDTVNYWYGDEAGDLLLQRGMFYPAIQHYESLRRQYPSKGEPLYNLAELYLRIDSIDKCLSILDDIETLDGVNPNVTLQKFYLLKEVDKMDEAFGEYDKLIKRYPYDLSYRIRLGDLQMEAGMIHEAKKTYDEAARIDPDNAYLWIAQSNYYSITGNQTAADTLVEDALLNANLDIDTKIKILTEYLKTSLRKMVKEQEQAGSKTLPGNAEIDSLFVLVATMHPSAPEVYDLHAEYLSAIGQDSLAVGEMRFAVDLRPSNRDYWGKLMDIVVRSGNYDMAMQYASEALKLHPTLTDAYMVRSFVYVQRQQKDSVVMSYKEALEHIDNKEVARISQIWGYLGDTYHELGDTLECYRCYDQALRYNERNFVVLNNYAYFLCLQPGGDLLKAERMAAKVVQQYPDNATYLDTYAWIYYLQGNYVLARFYQQRAMDRAGDDVNEDLKEHYRLILKACEE